MTRAAAVAALCVLVAAPALAAPAGGGPARGWHPPPPVSPEQIVRRGVDRLTGFLAGAPDAGPDRIRKFLAREIAPYFDFAYMARWAAGPLHRRLTDVQRVRFADKLEAMFLTALARNLGSFSRPLPNVDVLPARRGPSAGEASVRAWVEAGDRPPVRLDFRFYWDGWGWRVFDVAADGASAVAFYRTWFGRRLRRYGPDAVLK